MSPEKWRQIEKIYFDALECEPHERAAFLDRACVGDGELRREVETLIAAHHDAGHFITAPAMDMVARQMAEQQTDSQATITTKPFTPTTPNQRLDTQPAPALASGTVLGNRYFVEREVGQGGVGEVYLARDRKLVDTRVVIKVLREQLRDSAHRAWFEKKFKQEITALSRIDHPGVVRALDVGELPDGRSYFVMQYVSGACLRDELRAGGMDFRRAAHLLRQMGHALTAAHRQGVIHRDLKPENVMLQALGDEEFVKLIDFGIATVLDDASAGGMTTTNVIGTREYMAPEQLMGRPEAASDTYALGVVAYEMLTGRRPFDPASVAQLYDLQKREKFVRPRQLRPDLPVAAEEAIIKALSFAPERRFASAKDFTETLARALTTEGESIEPSRAVLPPPHEASSRNLQAALIVAAMVLIVVGAGAAIWWRVTHPPKQSVAVPASAHPVEKLPERELSYSLTVRKDPARFPKSKPFLLPGEINFEAGYQVRLNLTSPETGYLYVINEGPAQSSGRPSYNVLFPEANGSAQVRANASVQIPTPSDRPDLDWFVFDAQEGVEKVWLVWTAEPVAALEAVKRHADARERGEIKDPNEVNSVAQFLNQHATPKPSAEKNEANTLTRIKGQGGVLVGLVRLEHH